MFTAHLSAHASLFLDAGPPTRADEALAQHEARLAAIEAVPVEDDVVPSSRSPRALPGHFYALAMAVAELPGDAEDHPAVIAAAARVLRAHARQLALPDRAAWVRAEALLAWQVGVFRAPKVPGLNALLERAYAELCTFLRRERLA